MATGSAVIRRTGARGAVWYVRWRDASGRIIKEKVGAEADGMTRRKARRILDERLTDVRRSGLKRPERVAFRTAAEAWLDSLDGLKATTLADYEGTVRRHLIGHFGSAALGEIDAAAVEAYIKAKRRQGIGASSIGGHLNRLRAIFEHARRLGQVSENPVTLVKRPRVDKERRWGILTVQEVGAVERAFRQLIDEAQGEERRWREQARVVFLTVISTGLRRGEVLGLLWKDVLLADPQGPSVRVERQWCRGAWSSPKSRSSVRTVPVGPRLAEELFQHRATSRFAGDDERVFCHPSRGSALDHGRYAKTLRLALARAGIEKHVRVFHDGRHAALTHLAASGAGAVALMSLAGHSSFAVTRGYLDLGQVTFRAEAEKAERWLLGEVA